MPRLHDTLFTNNLRQSSNVLLCECKLVKFKNVFLLRKKQDSNTIIAKRKEIELPPEYSDEIDNRSDTENHLSILSIDNSLESEYIITNSNDLLETATLETIVPTNDPFNSSCPICLEDFEIEENIILLACHHGYHKDCLRDSLRSSASCAYCKSKSNMRTYSIAEEMPLLWQNLSRHNYGVYV